MATVIVYPQEPVARTPVLTLAGRRWAESHPDRTVARLALSGRGADRKIAVAICNQYAADFTRVN